MKNLLIAVTLVGMGFLCDAQSMLKVRLADNTPINVSVDGRYFNKRGTSVTVGELPPGRHWLKIFVMSQTRNGKAIEEVVYDGKLKTYDGMISLLVYDDETQAMQVQEQDINAYMNGQPPAAGQPDGTANQNQAINNTNIDNAGNDNAAGATPAPTGTLSDAKIDNLKTKVAGKKTDTEKMNAIKDGLQGETFTSYQVGAMMDWFSFESSKVDFAEWAYTYTVDKDFFSDLLSKLTYKNYQDDLDKFIKGK